MIVSYHISPSLNVGMMASAYAPPVGDDHVLQPGSAGVVEMRTKRGVSRDDVLNALAHVRAYLELDGTQSRKPEVPPVAEVIKIIVDPAAMAGDLRQAFDGLRQHLESCPWPK